MKIHIVIDMQGTWELIAGSKLVGKLDKLSKLFARISFLQKIVLQQL